MKTLGDRLRFARNAANLSQSRLDSLAGGKPGMTANIENGKSKRSTRTVEIAQALGIRPEWLETGRGPMVKEPQPSEEALSLAKQIEQLPPQGRAAILALILAYGPAVPDERVAEFAKAPRLKR